MRTQERLKTMGEKLKNIVLPVVAYGGVAGILSGFLVGVFNFVARIWSKCRKDIPKA